MDLLFKRYASPFLFMDGMIQTGRFTDFVINFIQTTNQEKEDQLDWDFWLHKVWEGTFEEFKNGVEANRKNQNMSEQTIETTINESLDILQNFNPPPEEGGE